MLGENNKNISSVMKIVDAALKKGLGRDSSVLAFGGGVVCDIAAFAASLYMRGIGLVLVPTTLLSMVDASIGGKTGVDYSGLKNIIGSFYPAEQVLICVDLLSSLPDTEYRSGLAEVIKHGLLKGGDFLFFLEQNIKPVLSRDGEFLELVYDSSM